MSKFKSSYLRIALLQLRTTNDKMRNVQHAIKKVLQLPDNQRFHLITLPECFNSPYGPQHFREYAECIPEGYTCQQLSKLAEHCNTFIVGGSIPELGEGKQLYNTCTVWDPNGNLIAKHRTLHLLDMNRRHKETELLVSGNKQTVFNLFGHMVGIGVGHDIRFEEMARVYRNRGCEILIYPTAIDMKEGLMHWELMQRARAHDNQIFVVSASPARDHQAECMVFGHSMIVDPMARVMKRANEGEETLMADIDFGFLEEVRSKIPIFQQRRLDLYQTVGRSRKLRLRTSEEVEEETANEQQQDDSSDANILSRCLEKKLRKLEALEAEST